MTAEQRRALIGSTIVKITENDGNEHITAQPPTPEGGDTPEEQTMIADGELTIE